MTVPVKGQLVVGATGVDHSGPNYAEREYQVVSINDITRTGYYPSDKLQSHRISVRYSDGSVGSAHLTFKQEMHDNIVRIREMAAAAALLPLGSRRGPSKLPGFLTIDKIDWTPEMAYFIGWLAGPYGKVRFYLEARESNVDRIVNRYHGLTGIILTPPTPGLFSITSDDHKWSHKCEIKFRPTDTMPDALVREQREPGLISRYPLFWALVEHGFLAEGPQDMVEIRKHVPNSRLEEFDLGVAGQPFVKAEAVSA